MAPRRVVILGGGITGLAAAYRLITKAGSAVQVTLVEERERLGGHIRTERHAGFVIDGGPDAFVITKPQATALCRELGLGDRLIETVERNRRVYVQRHGRTHPLPEGLMLTVPTRLLPFATTPLLSWRGKGRVALDLVLPPRRDESDESLAHFVRRRLGREALDAIAEPLLGGIYAGDIHALSVRSTFPQLAELEKKHGSLIRGALAVAAERRGKGGKGSMFHSLLGGMGELVDELARRLAESGADVRRSTRVVDIAAAGGALLARAAPRLTVQVEGPGGVRDTIAADDVVVAVPAHVASGLLSGLDEPLARMLRGIDYLSTATVAFGFARADIRHPLDAAGVIVPGTEQRKMLAATFISSKWSSRAPPKTALLRVFLGGHRDPGVLSQSDDALVALAKDELAAVLGIRARPMIARVFRHERANPQPTVGHADRVRAMRARAAGIPGLWLAGAAFDGVGIPDCIRQADEVAGQVLAQTRS